MSSALPTEGSALSVACAGFSKIYFGSAFKSNEDERERGEDYDEQLHLQQRHSLFWVQTNATMRLRSRHASTVDNEAVEAYANGIVGIRSRRLVLLLLQIMMLAMSLILLHSLYSSIAVANKAFVHLLVQE